MYIDIDRNECGYEIKTSTYSLIVPHEAMRSLMNQYLKDNVRETVEIALDVGDGDWFDISKYPGTFEELVDEIVDEFDDEIDYGNPPTEEMIQQRIDDVISDYDMDIE